MENNRRGFLKKVGAMSAGAALVSANPLLVIANEASDSSTNAVNKGNNRLEEMINQFFCRTLME